MKKAIVALILLVILLPIIIIGGNIYNTAVYVISLLALNELINIKNTKKEIPFLIKAICFIALSFLVFSNTVSKTTLFSIDYRVLTGTFVLFLMPTVLYNDKTKYSVNDAFYLIGMTLFIGI